MGGQLRDLRNRPRVVIGTPGRIKDHLERGTLQLANFNMVVLDEVDRMLDMGFAPQIDEVLACVSKERQTLMFSATFPEEIVRFSKTYLKNPERIAVSAVKANAPKIKHEMEEQVAFFQSQGKLVEAERIKMRVEYDMEMLSEVGYVNGIENYSMYLGNRNPGEAPATLMEFFPEGFLTFVDESHITIPQVGGMYAGDRARKENLV